MKPLPRWDGRRLSVYVGVNRRGAAGLFFQQQDPAVAARWPVRDEVSYPIPPLRTVPLRWF